MNKIALTLLISLIIILTGCDDNSSQAVKPKTIIHTSDIENVSWMRDKLPSETLAYFRIPTFWQLFFDAKGDALHTVQNLEANKDLMNEIKSGIVTTYDEYLPDEAKLAFKTLIQNMVSPFEMAIINATDGSMVPNSLFATTLQKTSLSELTALFQVVIENAGSQMSWTKEFDSNGNASLIVSMMPVFVSYDENSGKLALFSGLTASAKGLQELLAQNQHAQALNKIIDFEKSVDDSGNNLEMWVNIQKVYQQNQGFIPVAEKQLVQQFGLDKMEFLWVGSGSKNGKSEFVVHLAMPDVGVRQLMPRVDSEFDVETAGNPRSVWQLAMPSLDQLIKGFEWAISFNENPEQIRQEVIGFIGKVDEFLKVPLSEIYALYGQKLLIVTDDSGTWFASKIVDVPAHNEAMEKISQAFKSQSSTKKLAGIDINESVFSTKEFENIVFGINADEPEILKKLDMKQHMYYQIEGNYLIQAFTPQALADRGNSTNKKALSHFLNKQQVNWDSSIFAHSKEVRDLSRDVYHTYLSALVFFANFANVEVDLFDFPTAQQLNLPEKGRFGFAVDSSAQGLTMRLSYEYSILENMTIASSYLTLAVIGILGAYAIPAYNDYTIRSRIGGMLYSVTPEKLVISEYYVENKSFPSAKFLTESVYQKENVVYNPENGELIIDASENGSGADWLKLIPIENEQGFLDWHCSGNLPVTQMPSMCVNED